MLNGRLSAVNSGARRISCCHPRRYLAPAAPWPRLNSDERRAACISGKKRGDSQWRKEIVGGLIAAHAFLVFCTFPAARRDATLRDHRTHHRMKFRLQRRRDQRGKVSYIGGRCSTRWRLNELRARGETRYRGKEQG